MVTLYPAYMSETPGGTRSQVRRLPDRGRYDDASIHAILDAAFLCHLGFLTGEQPFVIPTLFARRGNKLYMHGSSASRTMRQMQTGIAACVTVTIIDGLVLARSAFHHSINYRSVVAFGTARLLEGDEKKSALEWISENVIAGRWQEVRPPTELEYKATSVVEFTIEEASAKVRTGPPKDDAEDYAMPVWAGVVPMHLQAGTPIEDPRLAEGTPLAESVKKLLG